MRHHTSQNRLYGTPNPNYMPSDKRTSTPVPNHGDTAIYVDDSLYNTPAYQKAVKENNKNDACTLIAQASVIDVLTDVHNANPSSDIRKEFKKIFGVDDDGLDTLIEEVQISATNAIHTGTFHKNMRMLVIDKDTCVNSRLNSILRVISRGNIGQYPNTYKDIQSTIINQPLDVVYRMFSEDYAEDTEPSFIRRNGLWIGLGVGALVAVGVYHYRSR